ncbi:hypothetical protein [Bythopirellula goksoeyrii]|uniref:Uncharacterized protein n=1 Tax=Bythopirellula goksoeyrii TaxID=1400387 RepID=A0A5B9QB81_9BACT|nr:hypothetical protein [Bythopirellula goksoeyrii]QEG34835.1 hypothetical protein Pr1d_21200 [Bythopirellula goksoeyrii]
MRDSLTIRIGNCTHNDARLVLEPYSDSEILEVTGFVRGPFSEFAKTLTADFKLRPVRQAGAKAASAEVLVMEPCYWTPKLPFLYELHLKLKLADGSEEVARLRTGIKRLHVEGCSLRLQGKRIVLRGLRCNSPDDQMMRLACEQETALVVGSPSESVCESASRLGVPLIADLRDVVEPWQDICRKLDWYPAVCLVLLKVDQLTGIGGGWKWPQHSLVAAMASASSTATEFSSVKYQALAVELASGERPPGWLATTDNPVFALSSGTASSIEDARALCDRWQTELAPEFDLAGYIV